MSETKVNRDNFIALQGFMITDLKLKGNELIIYACIYGFSQAENQVFSGSLQYLADWTNSTKQGVIKCLKSLIEKGYIHKTEKLINGVKFCEYYATKFNGGMQQSCIPYNKVEQGIKQSLTGGMQQSLPNNIDINNISKNIDKGGKKQPRLFTPPTLSDVQAYCKERNNSVNAQRFIDYYTANGWKVGKNKMKDWKAAVRTWENNSFSNNKPAAKVGANGIAISDEASDLDDLF